MSASSSRASVPPLSPTERRSGPLSRGRGRLPVFPSGSPAALPLSFGGGFTTEMAHTWESRYGRHTLSPLLPRAHQRYATPLRSTARRLRRWLPSEGCRRALRPQLRRLPPAGVPVPGCLHVRTAAPLFTARPRGRPPAAPRSPGQPERPAAADCRIRTLAPGYRASTRLAGLFLFLPLLARVQFDHLVRQAGYPGSQMIPAPSALLSLLALKLLDKERRSHIDDFNFDEALGLFAGLNILPKKSYATAYSYRTGRDNQRALLAGWGRALSGLLFPQPEAFSLDFHAIPYRGDDAGLDRHYLPRRGKAGTSVLTFFALETDSRFLCYANANLTRADQPAEPLRFV